MRSGNQTRRWVIAAAALLALGIPAQAYYHYVYYYRSSPFFPMQAKFDLAKLTNNTVNFYVNDAGPSVYFPNDSFASVLGEVKQAAAAWNAVPTSALRVNFGGLRSQVQNANTPGGEVMFDDLGPGVLGLATVNLPATPRFDNFTVPITHSLVILSNDTNLGAGPSYRESFFTTAVHEIGHALGMQHTWTGSAMSQGVIRNTSRTRPLDADDIAGISVLYPAPGWMANYGSISGRVSYSNGQPAVLASVVAISTTGPAVSSLTNPDGSYTINGLPPNTYQLYVHPLPPDSIAPNGEGLQLPADETGRTYQASQSFRTVFYPNTIDPTQATTFTISAGTIIGGRDFTVQTRTGVPAYDLITYSYLDPASRNYSVAPPANAIAVTPAFIDSTQSPVLVTVQAPSPMTTPVPQSIALLGFGTAPSCSVSNLTPCFRTGNNALYAYFGTQRTPGIGPRHMIFNFGNDIYVLPNAVNLVQQGPPSLASVNSNNDGTFTVSGSNLGADTRVYFDGLPANGVFNAIAGGVVVTPPGGANQLSTVTAYNADGQNSTFLQQQNLTTFAYPFAQVQPQIQNISPSSLPAGGATPFSSRVEITTTGTQFVDGQVTVGFGTSDVTVTRVWVLSPTRIVADVMVAPGAATGPTEVSIISGFTVMQQQGAFQIVPPNSSLPQIALVTPATWNPGSAATIWGQNLGTPAQVSLNGTPLTVTFADSVNGQWNIAIPAGFATGTAILTVTNAAGSVSLQVAIGNPAPTITGITNSSSAAVDATHMASAGDVLTVSLGGLDPNAANNPSRVQVTVSGLPMTVTQVGASQIQFVLGQSFGSAQVPVTVSVDGSASAPFVIGVR